VICKFAKHELCSDWRKASTHELEPMHTHDDEIAFSNQA
jgi:hypothetical protein